MEKQNKPIEEAQNDFNNAQISVTKKAAKRLKTVMASEGKGDHYLRMSVDSGGCSGMNYKMDFDNKKESFDKVF